MVDPNWELAILVEENTIKPSDDLERTKTPKQEELREAVAVEDAIVPSYTVLLSQPQRK